PPLRKHPLAQATTMVPADGEQSHHPVSVRCHGDDHPPRRNEHEQRRKDMNMSEDNRTIYEVLIDHAHGDRRAIIRELVCDHWPTYGDIEDNANRKEVANFICIDMDEADWLERHGKKPFHAYRRMTAVATSEGEFDEITMHAPGSYRVERA